MTSAALALRALQHALVSVAASARGCLDRIPDDWPGPLHAVERVERLCAEMAVEVGVEADHAMQDEEA